MRWVLLALLTLLAALAALAIAQRTKPSGRAELALSTCILWNFLLGCPIYALGLTGHLTAGWLGWTSGVFFVGAFAAASWGRPPGISLREALAGAIELLVLPFDGIARAARARSLVVLALLVIGPLIAYTAVASYFTPSWRQWDSLWYHETIVGMTIQSHTFAPFSLPDDTQKANGYPRFCEMIQLWFVIFTDRRLIELPNSLVAPGFMYATYLIARRYSRDVVSCMGWAAVAMLMPNASYLLESTYIDLQVGLFVLAGSYYASRPTYRLVDAWLAAICITLAVGSKYLALPAAGVTLIIALARLLGEHRFHRRALGTLAGGGLLIAGMSAEVFWRNWKNFHNPLWPDFTYDNPARHIHFPSVTYGSSNPLDMNMSGKDLFTALVSVPYSIGGLGHRGQVYDYGIAITWVVLPLSAFALLFAVGLCARDLVGRLFRVSSWLHPEAYNPLLVALPVAAQIWMSPALWGGRYHIANVGALAGLIAFVGGRRRWSRFGEGAATAGAVLALVTFYWFPRWYWLPSELADLAAIPYPEREVTPAALVSKSIDVHSGSAITREVGLEREKLKPGEIVAFTTSAQFPALLWNNAHTNKLVFVLPGPGLFQRVNEIGARWVYCRNGDPDCAPFVADAASATPTWKDLGMFNTENWGRVYRRLTP